ncbi:MAG TPA: WYL domain-containing protein [Planctomycetaceae bacterium]
MADAAPLVRQWLLLRTLAARRHGATLRELAGEAGVCLKTVRRDLQALAAVGFPLACSAGEYGRKAWRLEGAAGPPLTFTPDEAAALYLGRRLLDPLAGTYLWEAAGRAFRKIRAHLGEPALRHLEKLGSAFHATAAGASDYARRTDLLDALLTACEDRRAVRLAYQSLKATEPVSYEVHPYGFVWHRHSLYLVAHSPDRDGVRTFKLDRVADAELRDARFVRPEGLSLERLLEHSFGVVQTDGEPVTVRARFSPAVARYVEEQNWHPSQRVERLRGGGVVLELRLSHTGEFKRWVYSFGAAAEVLGPPELRAEVAAELREMAARYGDAAAGRRARRGSSRGRRGAGGTAEKE